MNLARPSTEHSPSVRPGRADASQRHARLEFYLLLIPVFLKVLWLHWFEPHDRQFSRLGRLSRCLQPPLPVEWAGWAAYRTGRILGRLPILRRRPCYWRSLVVYELLPWFGFPAKLHLGASFTDGKATPHVWVSTGGVVLADDPTAVCRYAEAACHTAYPNPAKPEPKGIGSFHTKA